MTLVLETEFGLNGLVKTVTAVNYYFTQFSGIKSGFCGIRHKATPYSLRRFLSPDYPLYFVLAPIPDAGG